MKPSRRRSVKSRLQRGFTVLEVLVALTIMGFSIALLYRSLGDSVQKGADLIERQSALIALQGLLDAFPDRLPGGDWSQPEQAGSLGWQIEPAVQDVPPATIEPLQETPVVSSGGDIEQPLPVRMAVRWGSGRTLSVLTWRLPPPVPRDTRP